MRARLSSSISSDEVSDSRVVEKVEVIAVDADVVLDAGVAVDVGVIIDAVGDVDRKLALAQFGRERPEAQPGGFWADQRPKTGGRSRPNCARREPSRGLVALFI